MDTHEGIGRAEVYKTIIQDLGEYGSNHLWIKREDLIPFSFGGNKARKAQLFFEIIDRENYDCVVTYGSGSSNHCRVITNLCCQRGMGCYIISPQETAEMTYNSRMIDLFGAEVSVVPVNKVHDTIEQKMAELIQTGHKPFQIQGGGHGNTGTEAYVQCYQEIKDQEQELDTHFDYIFLASGTGTTQAGLVCGQLQNKDTRDIIGISIARKNPYGKNVVKDSIRSYLGNEYAEEQIDHALTFLDDYTDSGYGRTNPEISRTIVEVLRQYGIPLDATYTGKAFWGMQEYIKKHNIKNKNILFIHTGGTPLFFDYLKSESNIESNEVKE